MFKTMDQEMMQIRHELKELSEKVNHIMQKIDGSMGQRGFYGMRGGQQGGYSGGQGYSGQGGSMGQREPWMMHGMQQFPQQGMYPQQGMPQQDMMQGMNPLYFM